MYLTRYSSYLGVRRDLSQSSTPRLGILNSLGTRHCILYVDDLLWAGWGFLCLWSAVAYLYFGFDVRPAQHFLYSGIAIIIIDMAVEA